jgi:hypothetical protein
MIDHDLEAMIAENRGHELGCFEELAEEVCEAATARGIRYATGAFTEMIESVRIIDRIEMILIEDPEQCRCERRHLIEVD